MNRDNSVIKILLSFCNLLKKITDKNMKNRGETECEGKIVVV